MEPVKLNFESRYGKPRTLVVLNEEEGVLCICGQSDYVRQGVDMFDFEGGPFIMVGEDFYGTGKITSVSTSLPTGIKKPKYAYGSIVYFTIDYSTEARKLITEGRAVFNTAKRKQLTMSEIAEYIYYKEEADNNNKLFKEGKL